MLHLLFLLLAFHGLQGGVLQGDGLRGRRLEEGDEPAPALELHVHLGAHGLQVLLEHLEGPVQPGGGDGEGVVLHVLVERFVHDLVDGGAVVPVHDAVLLLEDDFHVVHGVHRDIHDEAPSFSDRRFHGLDDLFLFHLVI